MRWMWLVLRIVSTETDRYEKLFMEKLVGFELLLVGCPLDSEDLSLGRGCCAGEGGRGLAIRRRGI